MTIVQISGYVAKINPIQRINQTLTKRTIFITADGAKVQEYEVDFWNTKADALNEIKEGQGVVIRAYLNGRKYEKDGREGCFHSIVGDTITVV